MEFLQEVMFFNKVIPAGTTTTIKKRVKDNGTVEHLTVRFYRGQESTLRVNALVNHIGDHPQQLISYPDDGDNFMSGDDDTFNLDTKVAVWTDDEIHVIAQNTSAHPYNVVVMVTIDYLGGINRV